MKQRKNNKGFTFATLLLVLAIFALLGTFSFVYMDSHRRSATSRELDDIAREIFIAAQNHLTMAEGQNFYGLSEDERGQKEDGGSTELAGAYYYIVSAEEGPGKSETDIWDILLPDYALDDTTRSNGTYLIRYRMEPAQILDVFYAERGGPYGRKSIIDGELSLQQLLDGYRGEAGREQRSNANGTIIGWFGVEAAKASELTKGAPLEAPSIEVVNAERLEVYISDPNASGGNPANAKETLKLLIRGETSKCELPLLVKAPDNGFGDFNDFGALNGIGAAALGTQPPVFHIVLDDVTEQSSSGGTYSVSGQFYRFCNLSGGASAKRLLPGENITISAVAYNNSELTNIAFSGEYKTNSLFAERANDGTVTITNFRHLENLDPGVSGVGTCASTEKVNEVSVTVELSITGAVQTGDLEWADKEHGNAFLWKIRELKAEDRGVTVDPEHPEDVFVYRQVNKPNEKSMANCYLPVSPVYSYGTFLTYNGAINQKGDASVIRGVTIDTELPAGLFGTLSGTTVSNLELVNFSVTSSDDSAGALAGVMKDGAKAVGVLARHEENLAAGKLTQNMVSGKTAAGGLVGELGGGCTVSQCAAALLVRSSAGAAGGLIGTCAGTVAQSYSGGHTQNGAYALREVREGGGYGEKELPETGIAYISRNVASGTAAAGGLIGSMTGGSVTDCYSTCSVSGKTAAGGLLGGALDGEVKNCYCTGRVSIADGGAEGAFAGSAAAAVRFTGCGYFGIVNRRDASGVYAELKAAGGADKANIAAMDAASILNTSTEKWTTNYNDWFRHTAEAVPYDTALKGTPYSLKTVSQLANLTGNSLPDWVKRHYGDWPVPELTVVNN